MYKIQIQMRYLTDIDSDFESAGHELQGLKETPHQQSHKRGDGHRVHLCRVKPPAPRRARSRPAQPRLRPRVAINGRPSPTPSLCRIPAGCVTLRGSLTTPP